MSDRTPPLNDPRHGGGPPSPGSSLLAVDLFCAMLALSAATVLAGIWNAIRTDYVAAERAEAAGLTIGVTEQSILLALECQLLGQALVLAAIAVLRPDAPSFGRAPFRFAAFGYLAILPVYWGAGIGVKRLYEHFQWSMAPQPQLAVFADSEFDSAFVIGVMAVCIFAPIFEELLFRKFLFDGLRGWFGRGWALATTSILFGLVHVSAGWHVFLPLTVLGLGFGVLRLTSRGLLAPILAHAIHNSLTLAILFWNPSLLEQQQTSQMSLIPWWSFGGF